MYTTKVTIKNEKKILWWEPLEQHKINIGGVVFNRIHHHERADVSSPVVMTTYSFNGYKAYEIDGEITFPNPSFGSAFNVSNSQYKQQKEADSVIDVIKKAFSNR